MKKQPEVKDRRRFADMPPSDTAVSREEWEGGRMVRGTASVKENENLPADYKEKLDALEKTPGMSLQGRAALAEARPAPEFAVAPIVGAEELTKIKQVLTESKIRVPRGWLLLKKLPAGQKVGLLIMPEICEKPVQFGIVLLVGKGEYQNGIEIPPDVNPGNHVEFPSFGGVDKELLGADVIMIRQDEVMLIAGD